MSISFVGGTTATGTNGGDTSLNLTLISGLAQDDIVIVGFGITDNIDTDYTMAMVSSGWTAVPGGTDLFSNDVADTNMGVFSKFMGASPDSAAVVEGQGSATAAVPAACMAFRGVDLTTPFDVTPQVATGIDTHNPNPPSIGWSTSGAWVVAAGIGGGGTGGLLTGPTGYVTDFQSVQAIDTTRGYAGMGYRSSPADPEDPAAFGHTGSDSVDFSWCAVTMALRPAAEVGAATPLRVVASPQRW